MELFVTAMTVNCAQWFTFCSCHAMIKRKINSSTGYKYIVFIIIKNCFCSTTCISPGRPGTCCWYCENDALRQQCSDRWTQHPAVSDSAYLYNCCFHLCSHIPGCRYTRNYQSYCCSVVHLVHRCFAVDDTRWRLSHVHVHTQARPTIYTTWLIDFL